MSMYMYRCVFVCQFPVNFYQAKKSVVIYLEYTILREKTRQSDCNYFQELNQHIRFVKQKNAKFIFIKSTRRKSYNFVLIIGKKKFMILIII